MESNGDRCKDRILYPQTIQIVALFSLQDVLWNLKFDVRS